MDTLTIEGRYKLYGSWSEWVVIPDDEFDNVEPLYLLLKNQVKGTTIRRYEPNNPDETYEWRIK